jgi:hypothetical protein
VLFILCVLQLPEDDEEQRRYPRFGKRGAPQAFATKLFELLKHEPPEIVGWTAAGGSGGDNITTGYFAELISVSLLCCWCIHCCSGTSFRIHDVEKFTLECLPKYFKRKSHFALDCINYCLENYNFFEMYAKS